MDAWKLRAANGVVVTKIIKVGDSGEALLQAVTRYTNSQNAVREKDFLALTNDFRTWQQELAKTHSLYLEIQRGGWDSQKALQKADPKTPMFTRNANAADLVKVYGAGWMGEAGLAFGKNPPFLPDGSVFKRIVNNDAEYSRPFGSTDLFAAYLLQQGASAFGFGRAAEKASRRQSRFLFYLVAVDLLKDVLSRGGHQTDLRNISDAMVDVLEDDDARAALLDPAIEVIDSYFTQGTDNTVFDEPAYTNAYNSDLNSFLKWEKVGRSAESTPRLRDALAITKQVMGKSVGGHPSQRSIIQNAIKI
jgi:hypothetical protein